MKPVHFLRMLIEKYFLYYRADVKLTHGADEQAVFLRSYLVQNRLGDFYTHSSLQGGSEFSAISG